MNEVTPADIRRWSKVPFDDLIGPVDEATGEDPLQEEVDRSAALIQLITGWFYDADHLPPASMFTNNPTIWVVPTVYEPMLRKAVQMAVEWESFRMQPEAIESVIDFDTVQSFTTRSYSEVRRDHTGATTLSGLQEQVHPWPALAKLLAGFMNPVMSQSDVPSVRAPGMRGGLRIRWDVGRYIIDAGRCGPGRYSVYDERPGGMWFVPGEWPAGIPWP